MTEITKYILDQLDSTKFGPIDLKKYKHIYTNIPDTMRKYTPDDKFYESKVCSKILSIRKYSDDSINITFIDLDKSYKEKVIDENDDCYFWDRTVMTRDDISKLDFYDKFSTMVK